MGISGAVAGRALRPVGMALGLLQALGCGSPKRTEMTVEAQGLPSGLDPHLQDDSVSHSALFNVYEGLVTFDGDMRVQPGLAVRWENRDDATWRLMLRAEVKFHNGRDLTAHDVVASLERARRHPLSKTAQYLVAARGFRALDDRTVEIQTVSPYPLFLHKLAFVAILPGDAPATLASPVGTGPYQVARFDAKDALQLESFEGYWAGRPGVERLRFEYCADREARLRRLLEGHADVLLGVPFSSAERVRRAPGCRIEKRLSMTVAYLGLRCDRPPFSDRRVREALDLAIDRRSLVQSMAAGWGEPAGQMVGRDVFGHAGDIPIQSPDPQRARRLLREAGYPDGLDVDLQMREGIDATTLLASLRAVGIRVRAVPLPWGELMRRLEAGEIALYLGGVLCPTGDASDVLDADLHSAGTTPGYGSGNFFGYGNPELDRLIERAGSLPSMEMRLGVLKEAMRLVARDRPLLPLYTPFNAYGVRDGVEWKPRLDGFFRGFEASIRR